MKLNELYDIALYFIVLVCFWLSFHSIDDETNHITITLDTIEVTGEDVDG
jgi:uncharacterized membrane protein|tara:strand:- start:3118 stop:3267 length:150 start_codon:yes stop_codon:yes gene_type:complete